jgi:hypothetical protein
MALPDPYECAAECAQAIENSVDPDLRTALTSLQRLWTTLGDHTKLMTDQQLTEEFANICEIHAKLLPIRRE